MADVRVDSYGRIGDRRIDRFTITNAAGMEACIISYGAIVQALRVPDRHGIPGDIVLGFDTLGEYVKGNVPYFGAICGRVANRIAAGRFTLEGKSYRLATNDGPNSLHGGHVGFDKCIWDAEATADGVCLSLHSPDGEEGYPGALDITVTYTLSDAGELHIDYRATTDAVTIINPTNHSYFNLGGHDSGDVYAHRLHIRAPRYTPVDDTLIPTGAIVPVAGTPLDFLTSHAIGERIGEIGGYDHNLILEAGPLPVVSVTDPASGRMMEMETTEPAVQFYSGNFLDGTPAGKGGAVYARHSGFCLEAQHYPDSINHPAFPTTVLRPGEIYTQRTTYRFGIAPATAR